MMGLGLGLGLSQRGPTTSTEIFRRLMAEATPWTLTYARASGSTDIDGITRVGTNVPVKYDWNVAGVTVPLYRVMPSVTNLCTAQTTSSGLSSNTLSGISRTLVENTSGGVHSAQTAAGTVPLSDGVYYWIEAHIARGVGTRHANLFAQSGSSGEHRAGFTVNLSTGVAVQLTLGNGSVDSITSRSVAGGYIVRARIFASAWVTVPNVIARMSSSGSNTSSYTGDGTSSLIFTGVTLTANILPTHLVPEGATDLADNIQTQAVSLGQQGTIICPAFSLYKDWAAGTLEHAVNSRYFDQNGSYNTLGRGTTDDATRRDGAAATQTAQASALAMPDRALTTRGMSWDSSGVRMLRNGTVAASDGTYTAPWDTTSAALYLGNRAALDRAINGFVSAPLHWPRVLTATELAAIETEMTRAGRDFTARVF